MRPLRPNYGSLARSTVFVMAATLASSVLGFAREVTSARYYGTTAGMDAFLAAATIPTILFGVFTGALVSALVPTFSDLVARGEEDSAWRLGSTIFNALFLALSLLAALGWLFAPQIVPLAVHGFDATKMHATIEMTRWLLPTIVATSLAGVASSMLNAKHHFFAPALGGSAINIVTIVTIVTLEARLGIDALVLGTVLGLLAQLLVQAPFIVAAGMYRPAFDLRHPALGRIFAVLGPIMIGSAAGQIAIFFDRNFASTLSTGYIAGMNYATKIVGFPQAIFAAAIATVIFPLFASQFASSDLRGIRRSIVVGLRLVLLVTVPSVFGLIALARPITSTLFERGAFKSTATDLCAGLLPFAAAGLVGLGASVVLTRCCFACNETRRTVTIAVFTVILNVVLSLLWLPTLGARGLLLANSVSQTVQAVLLLSLVWRLTGSLEWKNLGVSALRILTCSVLMGGALALAATLLSGHGTDLFARATSLALELAIGGLVFAVAVKIFGVQEVGIAYNMIVRKLEARAPVA